MFGKSKDGAAESERVPAPVQQFQRLAVAPSTSSNAMSSNATSPNSADDISSISSGMTVIGKISGEGTVNIFGRVEGELRASTILISEGAEVEGDLVAEDLTVGGRFKGTIHANRVKLNSSASVEGDIFHRSLSIEENARFEGSSRRDDAVLDTPRLPLSRPPTQIQPPSHAAVMESNQKLNGAPDAAAHASPAAK
jgi:cytoskeletal protein CcmA (bactofilin family)